MSFSGPNLSSPCPSCSRLVDHDFNYCPFCSHMVRLVCPNCRRRLQEEWTWCPECGHRATTASVSMPTRVMSASLEPLPAAGRSEAELFNQHGVELYEAERYDEAIEQFHRAIALDPVNSLYHCNLAVALGERGDLSQAQAAYQRALELNPGDLTAHLHLGYAYSVQGQPAQARQQWEQLVAIAPGSPEAEEARDNIRSLEG